MLLAVFSKPLTSRLSKRSQRHKNTYYKMKTSNGTSKDHRDKIIVPDPVVKVSSKL